MVNEKLIKSVTDLKVRLPSYFEGIGRDLGEYHAPHKFLISKCPHMKAGLKNLESYVSSHLYLNQQTRFSQPHAHENLIAS